MKVLFICPYPLGESPSQRFRFEQYFTLLQKEGIYFSVNSFWSKKAWAILYKSQNIFKKTVGLVSGVLRRLSCFWKIWKYDFVFVHREAAPLGPPLFEWIIVYIFKRRMIFDFDDAIWLPNTSAENKFVAFLKWHSKVNSLCAMSYRVSCGNDYLASYARQFSARVTVNPTTINTEELRGAVKTYTNSELVIGWTGTHSTVKYFVSIVPILRKVKEAHPTVKFVVISNLQPDVKLESLDFVQWKKESEIIDLLQFDIGIMPLPDNLWTQGKCGFKALQYMALGIPCVISSVGVNKKIIKHGVSGFLYINDEEFIHYVDLLLKSQELRIKIGLAGKKQVTEHYSVSSNSSNFLSLFEPSSRKISASK